MSSEETQLTKKSSKVPEATRSIFNPTVPFQESIGEMYTGRVIVISGIPKPNASRMTFEWPESSTRDIALQIDVRFNYGGDQRVVARNSKKEGKWGTEEKYIKCFPFTDKFFELKITAEEHYFKVDVNDEHLFDFLYRNRQLSFADTLKAYGDVTLAKVTY